MARWMGGWPSEVGEIGPMDEDGWTDGRIGK